jgi:hypothetical protein
MFLLSQFREHEMNGMVLTIHADAVAQVAVAQNVLAAGNRQRRAAAAGRRLVELLKGRDS